MNKNILLTVCASILLCCTMFDSPFAAAQQAGDDECEWRILVAYSREAGQIWNFDHEDLRDRIVTEINNLNVAYDQSLIVTNAVIAVTIHLDDYSETSGGWDDHFERFRLQNEPGLHMEQVHTLRDDYQADMCVLIVNEAHPDNRCGEAIQYVDGGNNEPNAFAIVRRDCLGTTRFTMMHEIGHLQGAGNSPGDGWTYTWGNGHVFNGNRTIMSPWFDPQPRVARFSNPDVLVAGTPTGTANANNARAIRRTGEDVASYRTTPNALVRNNILIPEFRMADNFAANTIETLNQYGALRGSIVHFRAGQRITLNPGFHARTNSFVHARIFSCPDPPGSLVSAVIDNESGAVAGGVELMTLDAYPNPVEENCTIVYRVLEAGPLSLRLVNSLGMEVARLLEGRMHEAGEYRLTIDASSLTEGAYLCVLQSGGDSISRLLTVLK